VSGFRVAVECYADVTLVEFLRDECDLRGLVPRHVNSQGEVVKAIFQTATAEVGIVDEDPNKPHHRLRDQARLVWSGVDVELRELDRRHLLVVKTDLETCFLRAMNRLNETSWFESRTRMHRILQPRMSRERDRFKKELARLRDAGKQRGIPELVSEIAEQLRKLAS